MSRIPVVMMVFAAATAAACTGFVGESNESPRNETPSAGQAGQATSATAGAMSSASGAAGSAMITGGATTGTENPPDPLAAGPLPLRRLTGREYLNTIRDLLGDESLAWGDVPNEADDTSNDAFPFRQPQPIGNVDAKTLQQAAEQVVGNVASRLAQTFPCAAAADADEMACAQQLVRELGLRTYRRPPTAEETDELLALFGVARATLHLKLADALSVLVEAMLQSPGFLYHWEQDAGPSVTEGAVVQLGNYQVANRLSYFLWGSMPDDELFAAAKRGELVELEGLEKQARRLLQDKRAEQTVAEFFSDWLDVNTLPTRPKDPAIYPEWNQQLASEMDAELKSFAIANAFSSNGLERLLTGSPPSPSPGLAALYGNAAATERGGLLTLGGFLALTGATDGSSPVRRGYLIQTRLLCRKLPNPPAVVPAPAPPMPGQTTRARFEAHDQNPCTGGCHKLMDPIGYGFENYDGVGRYRTLDQGLPVDASGSIQLDDKTASFNGAVELGKLLASSRDAASCFSTQWLRYALNRWTASEDAASAAASEQAFVSAGRDVRELLVAIAKSRTFRYRTPAAGEKLP